MKSVPHQFQDGLGNHLAAQLDLPPIAEPKAYALFSHCFTCSKELPVVKRISESLTSLGIAVFRFDFPGLGNSEGCFSDSTFSTNVDDLYRASNYLADIAEAPQILIGHSLGGTAAIRVAPLIDSIKAVVTIGSPAEPLHVAHLFADKEAEIKSQGKATVSIARREFLIKKAFLDDLENTSVEDATRDMGAALLLFHSPVDKVVDINQATKIYQRARHPKSFVSLDQADHLVSKEPDARYIGEVIAAWVSRHLDIASQKSENEVTVRIGDRGFQTDIVANGSSLIADEPISVGGTDRGPTPYDYLSAGLGACTAMTLRMYADRKKWPLESVEIELKHDKVHQSDCNECDATSKIDQIERSIVLTGDLSDEQIQRLLEIADRCPVHRTLMKDVAIVTKLKSV